MGEAVSPEECFTLNEYPPFLPPLLSAEECPPHPPHPSSSSLPHSSSSSSLPTTTAELRPSENCVPHTPDDRLSLAGKKPSAFTPVDTNRVGYVTPDLFAEPGVGKAVASSTPLPRALAFTRVTSCDSSSGTASGVIVGGGGGGGEGGRIGVGGANTRPGGAGMDVGSVRMVLDFGSGPKSSRTGGGGGGSESWGNTPVFGVLPASSSVAPSGPSSGGCGQGPATSPGLTPEVVSQVSPSWSARPSLFTRQLLTAPVAPKKRVSHTIPPPAFKFPLTPDVHDCMSDVTIPTNQITPSWSRDAFVTPPPISSEGSPPVVTVDIGKSHQSSKLPLKSALRRSERLRKSGTGVSCSVQRKVSISNLVHSSNASKFRHKSGTRDGERSPRKGSSRSVSGGSPVTSRGSSSPRKSSSGLKTGVSVGGGGGGRGGGGEGEGGGGGSGEMGGRKEAALRLAEQQAMASIGSLMNLLQQVGTAYQCLHGYDLATSLRCFRSLPPRHRSSAWCLSHMARVYHSGERYREAAKLFREVHSIDPHRQDGMELFASCLWHLRCDVELSVLTDSLLTSDPSRVEGACAKATSLNLARDHEGAVKCLQRAISLSPRFPYAHTLLVTSM
ncbi:Cell division cycle protein 27 homolog [Geodia barretti]|nr:Cell division cycle protein 27 homolog [Geodia barretti]